MLCWHAVKLGQPAAALAEPSDVVVPPLWGWMSSDLPLSRKKLLQHMTHVSRQASSVRRECGQARPGSRTLAEASTQMAEEELGFHAPSRFTVMPPDKPLAFDVDEAAEKRRRSLSGRALHKGLCITADAEFLGAGEAFDEVALQGGFAGRRWARFVSD